MINLSYTKKAIFFTAIVLLVIFILNISNLVHISNIFLALLLIPLWYLLKKIEDLEVNQKLNREQVQELNSENRSLSEKNDILNSIHDSLDIIFFSYDIQNGQLYISQGIEQISPFSNKEIMENPKLVKQLIRFLNDDFEKELDKLLILGERGSIQLEIKDQTNSHKWVEVEISPLKDNSSKLIRVNGCISNISEQKSLEQKLKQMAYYDELTDLPNRKFIQKHLRKTLARSKRHEHCFSVMFIDLDGFKKVNDSLGHECGDLLLIEVANRLNESVREEDLTGRLGGDEFMIVFEETNKEEVEKIAERIIDSLSKPILVNDNEAKISPSIGISMYPNDGIDIETLINNADKAMYYAKNNGKNNYQFYEEKLEEASQGKFDLFEKLMNSVTQSDLFQSVKSKF